MSTPAVEVIVAADQSVYDFLDTLNIPWDLQVRASSVENLWNAMEQGGGISEHSKLAFISADLPQDGTTSAVDTIATIAGAMPTFLIVWDEANLPTLLADVKTAGQVVAPGRPQNLHVFRASRPGPALTDVREATLDLVPWPAELPAVPAVPLYKDGHAPAPTDPATSNGTSPGHPSPAPAPLPDQAPAEDLHPSTTPAAPVAPVPGQELRPDNQGTHPHPAGVPGAPVYDQAQDGVELHAPQETSEADLDEALPSKGQHTISVTSSKGGAGKTTSALCLAGQIAASSLKAYEEGHVEEPLKVVVVDMDIYDGQVGTALGKYAPTAMNIRVAPAWDEENILANLVHSENMGIDLLLAPTRVKAANDLTPDFYRQVIRHLQRTHDVVILDTSVRFTDPLIADVCYKESSAIVFVTTLVSTAVLGMARAVKEITDPIQKGGLGVDKDRIGILVNQSVRDVGLTMDEVTRSTLHTPIIGAIPLATWDVQVATNRQDLHMLLKHPKLGKAYFKFANAVLPESRDPDSKWYLSPLLNDQAPPPQKQPSKGIGRRGR